MKRILVLYVCACSSLWGGSVIITDNQLAQTLSLSKSKLQSQSKQLAVYLSGQNKILKDCQKNTEDRGALCDLVMSLESFKVQETKAVPSAHEGYLSTPRSITSKTLWRAQQSKPGELLDLMKGYQPSEVMSWLPKLMVSDSCPQNLLLASLRMYEVALPSERAQASIELGYKRALRCLAESDPYHEITHIRQGLLRYMWGDKPGAITALKLALRTDKPKAKDTTLFWLGFLEKNQKVKEVYWNSLIEDYPLTFHAINAARLMGKDMYTTFMQKPLLKPQRKAADYFAQLGIYWLEALYMFGEQKAATTLSYRLSTRFQDRYSRANLAYIAALADKYNLPGEAMQLTSNFVTKYPGVLNTQTLRYLYPRPFGKTFDRITKKVDPLITLSVAKQESGFNPYARSPANARGLLQILPSTAAMYEPRSQKYLYDIDTNLEVGGKILADLINRLGRMDYALAAYNAGFNHIADWKKRYDTDNSMLFIDLIPYAETRNYVAAVLRNHYWYTSLYEEKKESL